MFARFVLVLFLATTLAWSVLARGSEGAGAGQPYRVRAGDTLWTIAARHYEGDLRQAVWHIRKRNDLSGGSLQPGMVLRLP